MRATHRLPSVAVIDQLFEQPHSFEFFQAVRLLETWFVRHEGLTPNEVMAQRLSFRTSLNMSFPASEIAQFETLARGAKLLGDHSDVVALKRDRLQITVERHVGGDGIQQNVLLDRHESGTRCHDPFASRGH